jgi:pilus assembly protein Flp/PilA
MKDLLIKLSYKVYSLKDVLQDERGQDLVEYALILALIAVAATAGMKTLATAISAAFTSIAGSIG